MTLDEMLKDFDTDRPTQAVLQDATAIAIEHQIANPGSILMIPAETGTGKTLGMICSVSQRALACAEFSAVIAVKTCADADAMYRQLDQMLSDAGMSGHVGIWTSAHKVEPGRIDDKFLKDGPAITMTKEEAGDRRLLVVTHMTCKNRDAIWIGERHVVIVDEDPG